MMFVVVGWRGSEYPPVWTSRQRFDGFSRLGGRGGMNDETPDLYAMSPEAVKEPPHRFSLAIRQIGPGLILAASIVGTGELINTTSLGAKAGFSLLWLILLSCVIKVFVQVELGRYAITHGKTTLAAFDSLPGPRAGVSWLCWLWLIMTLTTQAQVAAMEGTVGQAAHMAFPEASRLVASTAGGIDASSGAYLSTHQEYVWAAVTTVAAVALLLSGGYRRDSRPPPPSWSPRSPCLPWQASLSCNGRASASP